MIQGSSQKIFLKYKKHVRIILLNMFQKMFLLINFPQILLIIIRRVCATNSYFQLLFFLEILLCLQLQALFIVWSYREKTTKKHFNKIISFFVKVVQILQCPDAIVDVVLLDRDIACLTDTDTYIKKDWEHKCCWCYYIVL